MYVAVDKVDSDSARGITGWRTDLSLRLLLLDTKDESKTARLG